MLELRDKNAKLFVFNGVVCKDSHVLSIALEKRVVELSHHALKAITLLVSLNRQGCQKSGTGVLTL